METFQRVTLGSNLTLHAEAALHLDVDTLKAEYAAMEMALPPEERTHYGAEPGMGWTAIALLADGPRPALNYLPTVRSLLERQDLLVQRAFIHRQPAGGMLRWHFDNLALHRDEVRLLIPIQAPEGAVTLIGHEAAAYPEGQCWTGDFCFPHQVENSTDRDRIVLSLDVTVTDGVRALFPLPLAADHVRRDALAEAAQSLFHVWRNGALAIATA
jgi:hypothetical protein